MHYYVHIQTHGHLTEDSQENYISHVHDLHVVQDGEAAIQFIEAAEESETSPSAELVLLDLNLPKKSGLDVLARLRRSAKHGSIPVAIISSLPTRARTLDAARLEAANRFFTKPSDYDEFMRLGEIVKELLEGAQNQPHKRDAVEPEEGTQLES